MSHQLAQRKLQSIQDELQFLQAYLGSELFEKVDRLMKLRALPAEVLGVYRKTAEFMAEVLPEADQVVRDDVEINANAMDESIGGYLAVYFGVQSPAFETRRQFVGLAYHPDRPDKRWTYYIAGATTKGNLRALIQESAATLALHGQTLNTVEDFEEIKPKLEAVAKFYRRAITARKKGLDGFIPATAYKLQQTINKLQDGKSLKDRQGQAATVAYDFFNNHSKNLSADERAKLKRELLTTDGGAYWSKFVQMIFSGYEPSEAFEIVMRELHDRLQGQVLKSA